MVSSTGFSRVLSTHASSLGRAPLSLAVVATATLPNPKGSFVIINDAHTIPALRFSSAVIIFFHMSSTYARVGKIFLYPIQLDFKPSRLQKDRPLSSPQSSDYLFPAYLCLFSESERSLASLSDLQFPRAFAIDFVLPRSAPLRFGSQSIVCVSGGER